MEMGQLAEGLEAADTRNKRQVCVVLRAWPKSLVIETPPAITERVLLLSHLFLLHPVALLLIGLKGTHQASSHFSYDGNYSHIWVSSHLFQHFPFHCFSACHSTGNNTASLQQGWHASHPLQNIPALTRFLVCPHYMLGGLGNKLFWWIKKFTQTLVNYKICHLFK